MSDAKSSGGGPEHGYPGVVGRGDVATPSTNFEGVVANVAGEAETPVGAKKLIRVEIG